ncbi:hypothetical protein SNOG_07396 [Parastagonospora nodorum SN15]|uniref:Uncharacterized protein n=1 Tax=Phaeosphaeria nodorum (strain SN15 / ATCC MYA-4574 / FGSC 10173) TaxID=321614 RepID=Q0ULG8_PHANO|nr:hypothetical protein SNOG_07396 [Parastagonospora nodorum SN15]EAT84862.1 hypothetical protein SNOG_07396 [Parastagonospora nodorum SN15]
MSIPGSRDVPRVLAIIKHLEAAPVYRRHIVPHDGSLRRLNLRSSNTKSGRCASKDPAHFLWMADHSNCLFSVP